MGTKGGGIDRELMLGRGEQRSLWEVAPGRGVWGAVGCMELSGQTQARGAG